jgi:FAD/FMN-containing dehydrogenase
MHFSFADTHCSANDPTSITSQWASGYSCVPTADPTSTCTQGGWPTYVVNATTVRHVQLAINFARNRNLRLVIKNSGHDFNGRTLGRGALSVWVHNLKGLTYYPNYTSPDYSGKAVAYAGGTSSSEASIAMIRQGFSMHSAGGPTVALAGGYLQAGGHSGFSSWKGVAADHVISIQAVTADGRFVTLNKENNPDLFWAIRGGGGGEYSKRSHTTQFVDIGQAIGQLSPRCYRKLGTALFLSEEVSCSRLDLSEIRTSP